MIGDIPVRIMMKRVPQAANLSIHEYLLMRVRAAPGSAIPAEYPDIIIRIPSSTPPPFSEIINQTRHRETFITGSESN
jgi:hypothetical protein